MTIYLDSSSIGTSTRNLISAGSYSRYTGSARPGDVIIRWGGGLGYPYPRGVRILNRTLKYNKREQGAALMDAGVSIPRIYWSRNEWQDDGSPQLILKPEIGEAGVGIKLVNRPTWDYGFIYQKYVDKTREFRVTMVDNIFAYAMEKMKPNNNDVRWNSCRGSEWVGVNGLTSLLPKFKRLGTAGVRAIGYDIGATDMMLDADGHLYIIEINSKPGLGPQNAVRLVAAINEYLSR